MLKGRARELFEEPNICYVATINPDGTPLVLPVWCHIEGDEIILNSSEGRQWPRNLDRDPRLTITIADPRNPYEYVTVKGTIAERTHEGAKEGIDALAKKYLDKDEYPWLQPGEQRILFRVRPEKVTYTGSD